MAGAGGGAIDVAGVVLLAELSAGEVVAGVEPEASFGAAPGAVGVPVAGVVLPSAAPGAVGWLDEVPAFALASADCVALLVDAGFGGVGVLTPPQALALSNKATNAAVLM